MPLIVLTGCCSRPFPSCTCCPTHLWQWRSSSVSQQSVASKSTSSQHTLFYLHRTKLSVPPCPVIVAEPGWVILSNSYLRNLLLDCWLLTGERVFRQIQGESRLSSFLGTRSVALCCTPPPSPVPPHLRCGAKGLHCTHSSTTDRGGKKGSIGLEAVKGYWSRAEQPGFGGSQEAACRCKVCSSKLETLCA